MKHKLTRDELEAMTKDDLVALAEKEELTVTRGDGKEGDPVKADYVEALAVTRGDGKEGDPVKADYVEALAVSAVGAEGATSAPAVVTSKSREKSADETIPGGSYIVGGKRVNAHGKPIDAKGNVLASPESE